MAKAKSKGFNDYDWAELADERFNSELDFQNIEDEEDYQRELKSFLNKSENGRKLLRAKIDNRLIFDDVANEMFKNSSARDLVKDNNLKKLKDERDRLSIIQKAQRFERRRPRRSALPDERRTSKRIVPITKKGLRSWKRHPSKQDFMGVDTRVIRRRALRNLLTRGDLRLRSLKVGVTSRGQKVYRDRSGKFVRSPYRKFRR